MSVSKKVWYLWKVLCVKKFCARWKKLSVRKKVLYFCRIFVHLFHNFRVYKNALFVCETSLVYTSTCVDQQWLNHIFLVFDESTNQQHSPNRCATWNSRWNACWPSEEKEKSSSFYIKTDTNEQYFCNASNFLPLKCKLNQINSFTNLTTFKTTKIHKFKQLLQNFLP